MLDCPGGNVINLNKGYWRLDNKTDDIYYCSNLDENCLGGTDDFTCIEGNIGPLCEACDLYNEMYIRILYHFTEEMANIKTPKIMNVFHAIPQSQQYLSLWDYLFSTL